jgi:hypothetical protein
MKKKTTNQEVATATSTLEPLDAAQLGTVQGGAKSKPRRGHGSGHYPN